MLSHEVAGVREAGFPFSAACASHLVPLALQVDVLLVRLHLQLLHSALQLAVGLLQVVVVSKGRKRREITPLLLRAFHRPELLSSSPLGEDSQPDG